MSNGELVLEPTSRVPEILESSLQEFKFEEVEKWLLANFVESSEFDYDFSDWENDFELEESDELQDISLEGILEDYFSRKLSKVDYEYVAGRLSSEYSEDWRPIESRIEIEEVEEDDLPLFDSFVDAKKLIPILLERLDEIGTFVHPQIGHNRPPENYLLTLIEINDLRRQLEEAKGLPDTALSTHAAFLSKLAKATINFGMGLVGYVAKRGDLFVEGFMKSAGESSGKWLPAAISLALAGTQLKDFGEALLKLVIGG